MTSASDKQIAYIISLANEVTGRSDRFLGQITDVLPISRSAVRNLNASDASVCITDLKRQIEAKTAGPAPVEAEPEIVPVEMNDTITPADLINMIGKVVEITSNKSGNTYRGRVYSMQVGTGSRTEGQIVLNLNLVEPGKQIPEIPVASIGAWRIVR